MAVDVDGSAELQLIVLAPAGATWGNFGAAGLATQAARVADVAGSALRRLATIGAAGGTQVAYITMLQTAATQGAPGQESY